MSSPLLRLKRARRTPLLNKTTSFRRDDQDDAIIYKTNSFQTATAALYPYITSSRESTTPLTNNVSDCGSVDDQIINGLTRDNIPNDNCLLTSMATRLLMIERELLSSKREIIEKDNRIISLEELLAVKNTTSATQLKSKCNQLQQQVNEMKKFLNDYGMEWIGDTDRTHSDNDHTNNDTMWFPHSSIVATPPIDDIHIDSDVIDFDKLISNIKELNIIAGEDTSIVCKNKQGAMLKETGSIPLILYMNGLIMFQGPFRPYSDPMTQMCIKDIMDGYFPSELQYRYPEGMPFKVTDMRSHTYHSPPRTSQALFPGKGYTLKDTSTDNEPHSLTNLNPIVTHNKPHPSVNCYNENTQSLEKFLSRLPNRVIKNGKVINIHSELRDSLQEGPIINLTTDSDDNCLSISNDQIILLRIKLTNNKQVIMKMTVTNTVKELRQRIDMLRSHDTSHDYYIKTCYPNRTLTDNNQTLLQYGITCHSNIFIQSVTTSS